MRRLTILLKNLPALRGKFGPLFSRKLEVALPENHTIGLLEE